MGSVVNDKDFAHQHSFRTWHVEDYQETFMWNKLNDKNLYILCICKISCKMGIVLFLNYFCIACSSSCIL